MAKKSNNDSVILALKKQVEEKKTLLKGAERFIAVTNCNITLNGVRSNINTLDKEQLLILLAALGSLKAGLAAIIPSETLIISGYSVDDWIKDVTAKYANLNKKIEAERLKGLEAKLHSLLSIDKKVELEIDDLKNQI